MALLLSYHVMSYHTHTHTHARGPPEDQVAIIVGKVFRDWWYSRLGSLACPAPRAVGYIYICIYMY